jgi:threonine dehydratase
MVPSFHPALVHGVASYALELMRAVADLDVIYVPIGLGSGICGMIAAREALKTHVRNRRRRLRPRPGVCALL